jgi:glycosyltransferase involved in cell wall biosynthesis
MDYYKIPDAKISVVYLGSELRGSGGSIKNDYGDDEFLLYVGKRAGYKNFNNFINAYGQSDSLRSKYRIVAFGGGLFDERELELIRNLGIENRISQVEGNDDELINLYSSAAAFIYPSLYEGFGLPPLEAMKYGCPVLASDKGSISEICNEGAIYFDATNVDNMQIIMEKSLKDLALIEKQKQLGTLNAARYTWEITCVETLNVYRKLLR